MSRSKHLHLLGFAVDTPWAVEPNMLRFIATILAERASGIAADPQAIDTALALRKNDLPQPSRGGVAVIPMYGVLAPRANLLSESSGGTSFERLSQHLRTAANDSAVSTIVIDCDSPGGSCAGAQEFAALMREVRTKKPIIAQANHQMASAAYWVLANATKVHATPSATVGAIGVYTIHNDLTAALDKLGVKRTLISAGKYKTEGAEGTPLTDEGLAYRTDMVQRSYDRFVADIAKGRGVAVSAVKAGYGEGRPVDAERALESGMVDKVCTIEETLDRLLPAGSGAQQLHSAADTSQEPQRATDQDSLSNAHWQRDIERALLELSL
jgi:signal peptide peptidase SppA